MSPDIVIVGAGPVGLFSAIEIKLLNPALNIQILDRNKHYSRHHILRLEEKSLKDTKTYQMYDQVKQLNGFVPTSEIEGTFLNIAEELGIEIKKEFKVEDCKDLFLQYPSAHTIIGADGAHSVVRKQLFDDKKKVEANLQYIIEIKYKAKGKATLLDRLTYGLALGQVKHFISENVGKEKDGSTPVSLFIFVDKNTYEEVSKTPNAKLSDLEPRTKSIRRLLNTILPWCSLRKTALNEIMEKNSEKINGVALGVYQSECFSKEIEGKRVYLVGDAAAAVPYFRALNAGLIAAAETAKKIALQEKPNLADLNSELADLATNEISRAYKKNEKVNFGIVLNYVLGNFSRITTGACLDPRYERAMLEARVVKPNILRRNPRTLMAINLFLLTAAVVFPFTINTLSLAVWPALAIAFGSAVVLVATGVLLFKMGIFLMNLIKERTHPIEAVPDYFCEAEEESINVLSTLKPQGSSPGTSTAPEVGHYPSPLQAVASDQIVPCEYSYSI